MANVGLSFEEFYQSTIQDINLSCSDKEFDLNLDQEGINVGKSATCYGEEDWRDFGRIDSTIFSNYGFLQNHDSSEKQEKRYLDYTDLDHDFDVLGFGIASPPLPTFQDDDITKLSRSSQSTIIEETEPNKDQNQYRSLASFRLLRKTGIKRLNAERSVIEPSNYSSSPEAPNRELSTEEIMRTAGARFIQSYSNTDRLDSSVDFHPFDSPYSVLSNEESKDVDLAELLLLAAEKVGHKQYERAIKMLNECDRCSSNTRNPAERVVYYFSEALREKIDRETGRFTLKGLGSKQSFNIEESMMSLNSPMLACHERMPFSQIGKFAGIQAIIENVADAKKVHVVDLAIRNGLQWAVLMQALSGRDSDSRLELLKISAIGTCLKQEIEDTCKRLGDFAQSMNLPFSFKIIMVSDMLDLRKDHLELDFDETLVVYSDYLLRTLIPMPNQLENLMRVIKNINPSVMVITETEANHNSPCFFNRFIDALFYFSAFFDCLETSMSRDDPNRMMVESNYFGEGIRNIVATEGKERKIRNVKIDVWRAFLTRFGMVETELSSSSLYQANLVVNRFACGSSCTLDMNGKCLIVGWKGTPLQSLSVWKFV